MKSRQKQRLAKQNVNGDCETDDESYTSDDEIDLDNTLGHLAFDEEGLDIERDADNPIPQPLDQPSYKSSVSPLIGRLVSKARCIHVVGFNSDYYDINVLAQYLLPYFHEKSEVWK